MQSDLSGLLCCTTKGRIKMNEYIKVADAARTEGFVAGCVFVGFLWWLCG
tara:strand:- start:318 stop:467 length:150 start_codon:yes stop_codon:yes gene_type:complete